MSELASHYSRFRVGERLLLTGHSHQAWPDVAFEAQQRAWLDAAELVDAKWARAAEVASDVRRGWRRLLQDGRGAIALGVNTHELVTRFLSAVLPMFGAASAAGRPPSPSAIRRSRLVTTDGEFHTIRRQLDRIAEEGVEVVKVRARPVETLSERLCACLDDRVSAALVSSVLFETGEIVPHLATVAEACTRHGVELLVDAYHHVNVVPFEPAGLEQAFIVGGGYKYCQLGEGNCFLRVPAESTLRPVLTGWFSEFGELAAAGRAGEVPYPTGDERFAGATYDPTSHYRAAAVFAFHEQMGLTPRRLREISQHQTRLLAAGFEALDIDPSVARLVTMPPETRAGFVAIHSPRASELVVSLRRRGEHTDARGEMLRLGPAPYLSDAQLAQAIEVLGGVLRH
ncbi:MAG: kynureninase [Vicinamibacterales bacterium]